MINKMLYSSIASLALGIGAATAQATYQNSSGSRLRVDNGTYGPEIEEVHYCELSRWSKCRDSKSTRANTNSPHQTTINGPSE
jgi:hypothetical protein